MRNPPKVLIIIPAFNEENSLKNVISEVRAVDPSFDVLVVNDDSTDGTNSVGETLGVRVLDLPFNLGIGGAVQTGFKFAKQKGYDVVVQVDGDGQHDASFVPALVQEVAEGKADISIGSRYLHNENARPSLVRHMGIKFFSWLTSQAISQNISDCSSGFRALNQKAYGFFADEYPVDFPDAEALIVAHRAGLRMTEVPVKFRVRNSGSSSLRFWRMMYYPFKETLSIVMTLTKKGGHDH
jgi:glycosyltransferase involved in cell wall biosynthesis